MRKKWKIIAIIAAVIILLVVIAKNTIFKQKKENNIEILPSVIRVNERDFASSIKTNGVIRSKNIFTVTSDIQCKLATVNVIPGDYVHVGDVLCTFDASDIEAQIKILEEQLENYNKNNNREYEGIKRSLENAQKEKTSQEENWNKTIEEARSLADSLEKETESMRAAYNIIVNEIDATRSVMAESDDDLKASLQSQLNEYILQSTELLTEINDCNERAISAKNAVYEAEKNANEAVKEFDEQILTYTEQLDSYSVSSEVSSVTRELEDLKRKRDKVEVLAQAEGLVTAVNVNVGDIPSGAMMVIQDTQHFVVSVPIRESEILSVKDGMKANVQSTDNTLRASGNVLKVINFISGMTGDEPASYSALVELDAPSGFLLGMNANVKILLSDENKGLSVPYDAVERRDEGDYVYVASKTDNDSEYLMKAVKVEICADDGKFIMIKSDKIKANDLVAASYYDVNDGMVTQVYETYED